MNINEIIIETLKKYNVEFKHPYNIDYRYDSFNIDYFLPASKMFIILEYDNYNHAIYEDLKAYASMENYKTTIIPVNDINNEKELINYIYNAIYPIIEE